MADRSADSGSSAGGRPTSALGACGSSSAGLGTCESGTWPKAGARALRGLARPRAILSAAAPGLRE